MVMHPLLFSESKRVGHGEFQSFNDVKKTLSNKKEYNKAFKEWKRKKH